MLVPGQLVMRRCARLVPCCKLHVGMQVCCSWSHTCSFLLQQGTVGSVMGCIDRLLQRCAHQEVQCRTTTAAAETVSASWLHSSTTQLQPALLPGCMQHHNN